MCRSVWEEGIWGGVGGTGRRQALCRPPRRRDAGGGAGRRGVADSATAEGCGPRPSVGRIAAGAGRWDGGKAPRPRDVRVYGTLAERRPGHSIEETKGGEGR